MLGRITIALLISLVGILQITDLYLTCHLLVDQPHFEANPIAQHLIQSPYPLLSLVLYKGSVMILYYRILWAIRHNKVYLKTLLWISVAVLGGMVYQWWLFTSLI